MAMENKYFTTEMSLKELTKMVSLIGKENMNGRMEAFTKDNSKEVTEMERASYTKLMVLYTKVIIFLRK